MPTSSGNNDVQAHNNDDDDPIWIYVVISVAVLVAIVGGILLILFIYCVFIEKRSERIDNTVKPLNNGYFGTMVQFFCSTKVVLFKR